MANIVNKIKNKAKQNICWSKKCVFKKSICNIGRIVETDDKIICYVEQEAKDMKEMQIGI